MGLVKFGDKNTCGYLWLIVKNIEKQVVLNKN